MGNVIAIIPAAGTGSRMGSKVKKQYLNLQDKPVLTHTIEMLERTPEVTGIVVVVAPGEVDQCRELLFRGNLFSKILAVVPGGNHRQTSVYNGLSSLSSHTEMVVIHDGARPLVQVNQISSVIKEARLVGAAALAVPVKDTIKMIDDQGYIIGTPNREKLWAVQTPQVFCYDIILEAHQTAHEKGIYATDDCALVEALGKPVKLVQGTYENIKITTPEDMVLAEAFLRRRNR
ncbi:2-C-methyl-D-erythritol 4-phosphate cytidylyltransferase [Desulfotomaculum defluvii]